MPPPEEGLDQAEMLQKKNTVDQEKEEKQKNTQD